MRSYLQIFIMISVRLGCTALRRAAQTAVLTRKHVLRSCILFCPVSELSEERHRVSSSSSVNVLYMFVVFVGQLSTFIFISTQDFSTCCQFVFSLYWKDRKQFRSVGQRSFAQRFWKIAFRFHKLSIFMYCTSECLEIRMQEELTVWGLIIVPARGWKCLNIWEQL